MCLDFSEYTNNELMVFAKAPVAGSAKTRLIPALGSEGAAKLHAELVQRTLKYSLDTEWTTTLWCSPLSDTPFFQCLAKKYNVLLDQQSGEDLGDRMFNAFQSTFKHKKHVVIIGTDCPVLDKDLIRKVFVALTASYDAVIVPAEDGGYVLLGLTWVDFSLFSDISWGTTTVYEQTLTCLQALNFNCLVLPALWDIDRPEDLKRYQKLQADS